MKKNLFITGGFGQDAKILSNQISKKKFKIFIFHNKRGIKYVNKIQYIKENLLSKKRLKILFSKNKPDYIIHLAAHNPSINENNDKKFYDSNIKATKNIFFSTFETNKKAKFIFCSSSQIYKDKKLIKENTKPHITSAYTKFRIESHNLMLNYKKENKIKYTNAILFNHDSIFRNKKFLFPRLMKAIKYKNYNFLKSIIDSNIQGDFSHAEDICAGICKIIKDNSNQDNYILCSSKVTSVNEIIKFIIKKYKISINLPIKKFKKKGEIKIGDNNFAKKKLNWKIKKNIFIAAEEIFNNLK